MSEKFELTLILENETSQELQLIEIIDKAICRHLEYNNSILGTHEVVRALNIIINKHKNGGYE